MANLSSWTLHSNHNLCDLFSIKKNPNSLNNQHLSVFYSIIYNPDHSEQKLDMRKCIILFGVLILIFHKFPTASPRKLSRCQTASSVFKKHRCTHLQSIFTITSFSLVPKRYIAYLDQNLLMLIERILSHLKNVTLTSNFV